MPEKASPLNYYHYNKNLIEYARANRMNMTKAEVCIWKYVLSGGQFAGYHFKRQRPILNYIADFVCLDLMLVVEIDGYTHEFEDQRIRDDRKEKALRDVGFHVLRFSDESVLKALPDVIEVIYGWLYENKSNDI